MNTYIVTPVSGIGARGVKAEWFTVSEKIGWGNNDREPDGVLRFYVTRESKPVVVASYAKGQWTGCYEVEE